MVEVGTIVAGLNQRGQTGQGGGLGGGTAGRSSLNYLLQLCAARSDAGRSHVSADGYSIR